MGFSVIFQSGICCGSAFGGCEQHCSGRNSGGGGGATGSYLLGRVLRQSGGVYAVNIDRKFVGKCRPIVFRISANKVCLLYALWNATTVNVENVREVS